MKKSIRCPSCNQHVLQKSSTDAPMKLRLKGRLSADSEGLHAQCFWCSNPVTLPLEVGFQKASPAPGERFVLRTGTSDDS